MEVSRIIKEIVETKGCVLIRPRKEEHVKGTPWQYDLKGPFQGNKHGWTLLDLFTASAMLNVYNALKDENKTKFNQLHINTLVNFTWKQIS